jgi:hypothetical protein
MPRRILAASYSVDAAASQSQTTYQQKNRLPHVGAQVLADAAGKRRIVLYGFVATEFGKNDAAQRAVAYVQQGAPPGATAPEVENRIEIRPEIAKMKMSSAPPSQAGNESLDQVLEDINRYGVTMTPGEANPK